MTRPVGRLDRVGYLAQQWLIMYVLMGANRVLDRVANRYGGKGPSEEAREEVRGRFRGLLERDLENVKAGLYPKDLLFQVPFGRYVRTIPRLIGDVPRLLRRMQARDHQDLPSGVDLERYPDYYRRNFHWQTDGYLSRHSAELYDLTVELLFMGTADIMRRQVIPPISRFLAQKRPSETRLLDIGCGTGRTLRQIATTHPKLRLFGLDLSPYYLQVARRVLADVPGVSLATENGETLPFPASRFDVVTSVYLFHELPQVARRQVIAEAYRVLRPGGMLVIEDSIQVVDSDKLAVFMGKFAEDYHEPYYKDYIEDDIPKALVEAGFYVESIEPHYVSKVFVARK